MIDRRKRRAKGLLAVYGSFGVFEQDEPSVCRVLHTHRIVSQTSHIHQGPTTLARCPVELLTSEATSRDMRPAEGGPREGRGWWWWFGGGGVWSEGESWQSMEMSHFGAAFSQSLWNSLTLCRNVDSLIMSVCVCVCLKEQTILIFVGTRQK